MGFLNKNNKISSDEIDSFVRAYFYYLDGSAQFEEKRAEIDFNFISKPKKLETGTLIICRQFMEIEPSEQNWNGQISLSLSDRVPSLLKPNAWDNTQYMLIIRHGAQRVGSYQGSNASASMRFTSLSLVMRPKAELMKTFMLWGNAPPQKVFGGSYNYSGDSADEKAVRKALEKMFKWVCSKG